MTEETNRIEACVRSWGQRESLDLELDERLLIRQFVKTRTDEILALELDPSIDLAAFSSQIVGALGKDLTSSKRDILNKLATDSVKAALNEEEPRGVTELLWRWKGAEGSSGDAVEQELFRAIELELKKKVLAVFHRPQFISLRHKLDPAELISELYIKLKGATILRLPENRRQFFGLADKALERILQDIRKASYRLKRDNGREAVPLSGIEIASLDFDALKLVLDEEQELQVRQLLKQIPGDQAEVFTLRAFAGRTVKEVAEMTEQSESSVKRKTQLSIEGLKMLRQAQEGAKGA
jgi:RNA polymerase sigma factor (sigma-70 family)